MTATFPTPSESVTTQTVFVVEDDLDTRDALSELLTPAGLKVRSFGSAEEFLSSFKPNGPACLLVDERLPGMPGSELLRRLKSTGVELPTIMVTAFATTPFTVAAMRNGATAVLDKPCADHTIRDAVNEALDEDKRRRERDASVTEAKRRLAELSDSERQVLEMVLQGTPNKQIARRLEVCVRTVEARRSRVYQTTGVNSVAELVRLCVAAGFIDARP
ncbi:MAG: response regulator [Planctomycetota bacterium]